MLVLWPSSFVMIAASEESLYLGLLLISIAVTVVLYVAIGAAIWYGFWKNHVILALLGVMMIVIAPTVRSSPAESPSVYESRPAR